jgi:hypothetical protein
MAVQLADRKMHSNAFFSAPFATQCQCLFMALLVETTGSVQVGLFGTLPGQTNAQVSRFLKTMAIVQGGQGSLPLGVRAGGAVVAK